MRIWLALVLLVARAGAQYVPQPAPEQPLPFSHKAHADAKLECKTCHPNPDPGKTMGIARAAACMPCHRTVKPESLAIKHLADFAKKDRDIQWVRVYRIPAFVRFSHRSHKEAGSECEDCHGPVATRDQLASEHDLSQVGCLACHRERNIGMACNFCHD